MMANLMNFPKFAPPMAQHRSLLIINPIAGTSSKQQLPEAVAQALESFGTEVVVKHTGGSGDATRFAREAVSQGFDAVLAAGGDGTVNETAKGLSGSNVPLGIIPCGSGNGLARHLGIPLDIRGALDVLKQRNIVGCDHGSVNGHPFFCTFGIGFDATVSDVFARSKQRGKLTYVRSTVEQYFSYQPETYAISANGVTITEKAFLVAVCNASQYGNNAYIAPRASITDGLLDVTVVHAGNLLTTALVGLDLLTGMIEENMLTHTFRSDQILIERSSPGAVHLDGEPLSMGTELHVQCHAGALRVFTPKSDAPFVPIITPARDMMRDLRSQLRTLLNI